MDFKQFEKDIAQTQSSRWTKRQKRLDAYRRALRGRMYDHLGAPFSQERKDSFGAFPGNRVLLDQRRAAVQDRLPLELTRDAVGMIFGEGHRPNIIAKDDANTSDWIHAFIEDAGFWLAMIQAMWSASVGSGMVVLRVLGDSEDVDGEEIPQGAGAYHFEVWPAEECRPVFKRTAPDDLKSIERVWFISDDSLRADGYNVDALAAEWEAKKVYRKARAFGSAPALRGDGLWALRIVLDANDEKWFAPVPKWIYERPDWQESDWQEDEERSFAHELGFVPGRWVRPLPIDAEDLFPDGHCLFEPVIDHQFRIDRTLSQTGRAFDYAGDPQMARIKGDGKGGGFGDLEEMTAIGGTASDVVDVEPGGDAKFIEITGDGLKVAIDTYIRTLREVAREAGAMSRITPDSKAGTQLSAVAMKMLNFSQITLCDVLRITLGERAAVPLLRMAMRMYEKVDVSLPALGKKSVKPNPDAKIELSWPDYYPLHGQDKLFEVQATTEAMGSGQISQETGVANTAPLFDVQDSADELKRVQKDREDADSRALDNAIAMAAITAKSQLNVSESEPQ